MKAIVLVNGDLLEGTLARSILHDASMVIGVDGGARHAETLGISITHLVGDFDSIDPSILRTLAPNVYVRELNSDKDETDLEHALKLARELGATEVHLVGVLGNRIDHTLGNILIAANEEFSDLKIWLHSGSARGTILHGDILQGKIEECFETIINESFSIIPLESKVEGLSISGAVWNLDNTSAKLGSSMTISNRAANSSVRINIRKGRVLVVFNGIQS